MHISLTERRTFTAEIPGRTLTDLEIESEWNGLTKFVQPASGLHLIVQREIGMIIDGSESLMDDLLAPTSEPGHVTVPGRTIEVGKYKIVVPTFSVHKYMSFIDGYDKAFCSECGVPTVRINFAKSREACKAAGGDVIRGSQNLSLGIDVMGVDANWSGGKVGQGILQRGLHRGTVSGAVNGTYVSPHRDEKRTFLLSNGETVYDVAGHLYSWMFDDIHGNSDGLTGKIPADSPYLVIAKQFSQAQGMGYRPDGACDWSGGALIRGGCWRSGDLSGVFHLNRWYPSGEYGSVGFRLTK